MASPIDFYFDFSSPYGYVASRLVEGLAQRTGREIQWRPMLIGAVMKITGQPALIDIPMKGTYARRDFERTARYYKVPFRLPDPFPIGTVPAVRAFYWTHNRDPAQARSLAKALLSAFFVDGREIGSAEGVVAVARATGLDGGALAAALGDPALKERTRQAVEAAVALGVFGSPYFIVDGEPFWGVDRMPMLEEWVRRGGW